MKFLHTVPIPTVTVTLLNRTLGSSSPVLQCEVTTVRGINSTVDIVWSNGTELDRVHAKPVTVNNLNIYMETYMVSSQLTTESDGDVFSCEAVINSDPVIRSSSTTTLDVIGEICIQTYHLDSNFCGVQIFVGLIHKNTDFI